VPRYLLQPERQEIMSSWARGYPWNAILANRYYYCACE
jgi:hypothetical protein